MHATVNMRKVFVRVGILNSSCLTRKKYQQRADSIQAAWEIVQPKLEEIFGANANVRVNLGKAPVTDVIALLKVGGQVVDTQEIDYR